MTDIERYAHVGVERLAKTIHEAQRECVIQWDDLPEQVKEGRRMQAQYLLNLYHIIPTMDGEP